jgi:transcriptional accessory protein Tex/SPT6
LSKIKAKIALVLKLFRVEKCDIPYITRYRQNELIPELEPHDVWTIFNLDIEYGKFQVQKK